MFKRNFLHLLFLLWSLSSYCNSCSLNVVCTKHLFTYHIHRFWIVNIQVCLQSKFSLLFLNLDDCLEAINVIRRTHRDTPDLKWDRVMEAQARDIANKLAEEKGKSENLKMHIPGYGGATVSWIYPNNIKQSNKDICQADIKFLYVFI